MIIDGIQLREGSNISNLTVSSGDATAQGLLTPTNGELFYRTDLNQLQAYIGGLWTNVLAAGAVGGGSDQVFYENDGTINSSYTITTGRNAGSFGPITVATGVVVTVPAGSTWSIV